MAEISELGNRHPVLSTVEGWEFRVNMSGSSSLAMTLSSLQVAPYSIFIIGWDKTFSCFSMPERGSLVLAHVYCCFLYCSVYLHIGIELVVYIFGILDAGP
ncbi:hypothetical protein Peur_014678 [Populus x canadensis]